jgi:nucleoside-diphosphate-sugar epimerase
MYGSRPNVLIDESFPIQPTSFAKQYAHAEQPFRNELKRKEVPLIMLRLPWVIGNGSWFKWNYANYIKQKGFVPVYGKGNNMMSFIDVDIIGKAIIILAQMNYRGVVNLFHPEYLSQLNWAEIVASASGNSIKGLTDAELMQLPQAVREAFSTSIQLASMHNEVQLRLHHLHESLFSVVKKHLSSFQYK